jgi:uncharacterized cupredoxin-like copper-binding protein
MRGEEAGPGGTPATHVTRTLTFTATTPGSYTYLRPVPGHQKGMTGSLVVTR